MTLYLFRSLKILTKTKIFKKIKKDCKNNLWTYVLKYNVNKNNWKITSLK